MSPFGTTGPLCVREAPSGALWYDDKVVPWFGQDPT